MKTALIVIGVIVALVALTFISSYNSIVSNHEAIGARWSQVENQLQRRNDLIPNLVNTVKGYAGHEKEVFENITAARSSWARAASIDEKVKAASALDSALGRLIAVAENYPNLKADQTFLTLMDELSGTENRVAVERMRYNEAVRQYNTLVRRFPGNIIGSIAGYAPVSTYFKAESAATAVPEVNF